MFAVRSLTLFFCALVALGSCAAAPFFSTTFEPTDTVYTQRSRQRGLFSDPLNAPPRWQSFTQPPFGGLGCSVSFPSGSNKTVDLRQDRDDTANRLLYFSYNSSANGAVSTRSEVVQAAFLTEPKHVSSVGRMRFGPGLRLIHEANFNIRARVFEFVSASPTQADAFSTTVSIRNGNSAADRVAPYFRISSTYLNRTRSTLWTFEDRNFKVPLDKWFTLAVEVVQAENGLVRLQMLSDNVLSTMATSQRTLHPNSTDATAPGFGKIRLHHLYFTMSTIDVTNSMQFLFDRKTPLECFFDDWELYLGPLPDLASRITTSTVPTTGLTTAAVSGTTEPITTGPGPVPTTEVLTSTVPPGGTPVTGSSISETSSGTTAPVTATTAPGATPTVVVADPTATSVLTTTVVADPTATSVLTTSVAGATFGSTAPLDPTGTTPVQTTSAAVDPTRIVQSTAPASVVVAASSAPTTTSAPGTCVSAQLGGQRPRRECTYECCSLTAERRPITLKMSTEFGSFDCYTWSLDFAARFKIVEGDFRICSSYSGSSIVVTSLLQSDADRVMALAAQGTQGVPDFFEAVDNGRSVLVPQPVNIWLIIGLAVAGFLILLVIILAIYFCCKQCREKKSYSHYFYVPMAEKNARASEAAQFRPTTRNRNLTLIVIHDCNHDGEGVLRCREGDRLEVDPEDWFSPGEWAWAKRGLVEGWVPKSFANVVEERNSSVSAIPSKDFN